jgi:integral membrane protein
MSQLFKSISWFEAATYVILLFAVVLYRVFDGPRLITPIGWIHGLAFLAYLAVAIAASQTFSWSWKQTALALIASVVPVLGFVLPHRLLPPEEAAATHRTAS